MSRVDQVVVSETKTLVEVENQVRQTVVDKVVRHAVNVGPRGADGERGPKGDTGATGAGLNVLGSLEDYADLPTTGLNPGDGYIIDGVVWVWDGSAWVEVEWSGPELPRRLHEEAQVAGSDSVRETGWTTEGTPVESTFTRASQAWNGHRLLPVNRMRVLGRYTASPVVLMEGQRTNSLPGSDNLLSPPWAVQESIVSQEGPGEFRLTALDTTESEYPRPSVFYQPALPDSGIYTFSVELRRGNHDLIAVTFMGSNVSGDHRASFNLLTGELAYKGPAVLSATIVGVGQGWYRIQVTQDLGATTVDLLRRPSVRLVGAPSGQTLITSGGEYVYVRRPQAEEAPFASSYIPTDGAPATRAADIMRVNGAVSAFAGDETTIHLVTSAPPPSNSNYQSLWSASQAGVSWSEFVLGVMWTPNRGLRLYVTESDPNSVTAPMTPEFGTLYAVSTVFQGDKAYMYVNGELLLTHDSVVRVEQPNRFEVGRFAGTSIYDAFSLIAPGAAGLGIPFIDNRAWSEAEIQAAHARWLPELQKIEVSV